MTGFGFGAGAGPLLPNTLFGLDPAGVLFGEELLVPARPFNAAASAAAPPPGPEDAGGGRAGGGR